MDSLGTQKWPESASPPPASVLPTGFFAYPDGEPELLLQAAT